MADLIEHHAARRADDDGGPCAHEEDHDGLCPGGEVRPAVLGGVGQPGGEAGAGGQGLDLVKGILDELLATSEMQLVVLGSGDYEYESYFRWIAEKYPDKVGLRIGFVPELARKI